MTDRPILFSAPMVRALLDGRKTQTRRVLRNPEYYGCPTGDCPHQTQAECNAAMASLDAEATRFAVGDRLWVREAFAADGKPDDAVVWYRAHHEEAQARGPRVDVPWRPSIHMPRWASRLTLTVTDVRVERLQDISEADAIAEGMDETAVQHFGCPIKAYAALWNSLARTEEAAWSANPWVVAVPFSVAKHNIDAEGQL